MSSGVGNVPGARKGSGSAFRQARPVIAHSSSGKLRRDLTKAAVYFRLLASHLRVHFMLYLQIDFMRPEAGRRRHQDAAANHHIVRSGEMTPFLSRA